MSDFVNSQNTMNESISVRQAIDLAFQSFISGDFPRSESLCLQILKSDPNQPSAWHLLGLIARQVGKWDVAEKLFRKALYIKPNYPEAHNNLGLLFNDEEKYLEAIGCFNNAIALVPNFPEALNNLGNALAGLGKYSEAIEKYRSSIIIRPDYAEAYMNLGNSQKDIGRIDEALYSYKKSLSIKPDLPETLFEMGKMQQSVENFDEAVILYKNALDIKPDNAEVLTYLAILTWICGVYDECRQYIHQLLGQNLELLPTKKQKFIIPYQIFLQKLLEDKKDKLAQKAVPSSLKPIHVIGDSHSLSNSNRLVEFDGEQRRVEAKLNIGCKAWHLGNEKRNKYKAFFENTLIKISNGTKVILMFGEIDCRPDEGILQKYRKEKGDLEGIIFNLVSSYVDYTYECCIKEELKPIYYGVPPRFIEGDELYSQDEVELSFIISRFNSFLKQETEKRGLRFLDVYSLVNAGNGFASGEFHIDSIHLKPEPLSLLLSE